MNRAFIFARRNTVETLRSPMSWTFGLALPIAIFVIMQIIVKSIGAGVENVPMFGVDRFTGGVAIFGGAFLTMLLAITISGDRTKSFLSRLVVSPMKPIEFILGYVLGIMPFAVLQNAVVFIAALCFGLTPTIDILPAYLFSVLFSLLFVSLGVILGSALSDKSVPPVCSVVVQAAALLSGMWFDFGMIGGGFEIFCKILPFANCYDIIRYTLVGEYGSVWLPIIIVTAYTVVFCAAAAFVFKRTSTRG